MKNRNLYLLLILLSLISVSQIFAQNKDSIMTVKIGRDYRGIIINKPTQTAKVLKYEKVYESSDDLLIVYYNEKYGYIDRYGNEIIAPQYDYVECFEDGFAIVLETTYWSTINYNKEKHDENYISYYGKKGLIDKAGKIIVPLEFNELENFSEGLAYVGAKKPYFIDKNGNKVLPLDNSSGSSFSEGLAYVANYNDTNKPREMIYIDVPQVSSAASIDTTYSGISLSIADVDDLSDDIADSKISISVADVDNNKGKDRFGFIDKTNNIVIPLKYDGAGAFSEGLASVDLNGKYGFIDKTGKEVIPLEYDKTFSFKDGIAFVELNNKYGAIDKEGKIIIPLEFDKVEWNSNKLEVTYRYNKGLFDLNGTPIIPVEYVRIYEESDGVFMLAKEEGWNYVYSFINKNGVDITGATYSKAEPFSDGLAKVLTIVEDEDDSYYSENKYGFINTLGKMAIDPIYDDAQSFQEERARVGINNGSTYNPKFVYGFIDTKGKIIIKPIYSDAGNFSEGLACIKTKDDKWGYVNKKGKIVIQPTYKKAQDFHDGFSIVYDFEDKMLFVDKDGNEYKVEFEEIK